MYVKKTVFPYLAIISACILWGMNGVFANILNLPPLQQSFFRLLVPGVITGGVLFFQYHQKNISFTRQIFQKNFITISLLKATQIALLMSGYVLATVGTVTLTMKMSFLFAAILAFFLLGEKFTKIKTLSIIVGLCGLIFIAFEGGVFLQDISQIKGVSLALASAILGGLLQVLYKKNISAGGTMIIFQQSFLGMIIFGIISSFLYDFPTGRVLILAIIHSTLIGVVGFYLYFYAVRHLEISVASILGNLEIIAAMFFGYLFLDQMPSFYSYIGMICIIISGAILIRNSHMQRRALTSSIQE